MVRIGKAGMALDRVGLMRRGWDRLEWKALFGAARIGADRQDRSRSARVVEERSGEAGSCRIGRQRKEADGTGRTGLWRRGLIRGVKHWSGRIGWCRSAVARVASARKVAAGVVWVAMER